MKLPSKKNIHLILIISSLFVFLFSYTNCEGGKKSNPQTSGPISPPDKPTGSVDDPYGDSLENLSDEKKVVHSLNLGSSEKERSFFSNLTAEGILVAFSTVTKVPFVFDNDQGEGATREVNPDFFSNWGTGVTADAFYNNVRGNLPIEQDLSKFNSSHLNSIVSLASSFCEEVFIGSHPQTGERYLDIITLDEIDNPHPDNDSVSKFLEGITNWLIPHVNIDNSGMGILSDFLQVRVNSYLDFSNGNYEKLFFNTEGVMKTLGFSKKVPETADFLDFNNSFYISTFILPGNSITGTEVATGNNDKPFVSLSTDDTVISISFELRGHNIDGVVFFKDKSNGRIRHSRFSINDSEKNNLKLKPYHIVFGYDSNITPGDLVSFENDFYVYVNGEKKEMVSFSPFHWLDFYSGVDYRMSKNKKLFATAVNSNDEVISAITSVNFKSDVRLLIANYELFEGIFVEDLNDLKSQGSELFLNIDGNFSYRGELSAIIERGSKFFFGKVYDESTTQEFLLFKTDLGNITYAQANFLGATEKVLNSGGFDLYNYYNQKYAESVIQNINLDSFESSPIFEKPFRLYGPLLCTSIMSSQYFIFN